MWKERFLKVAQKTSPNATTRPTDGNTQGENTQGENTRGENTQGENTRGARWFPMFRVTQLEPLTRRLALIREWQIKGGLAIMTYDTLVSLVLRKSR